MNLSAAWNHAAAVLLLAFLNGLAPALAIALVTAAALRWTFRLNAATRYWIWWGVLALLLALPIAPFMGRRVHKLSVVEPDVSAAALVPSTPAPSAPTLTEAASSPLPNAGGALVMLGPGGGGVWPLTVLGIWMAAMLFDLGRVARSWLYLRGLKRRATEAAWPLPLEPSRRLARLLLSGEVSSPAAVGFVHPAIILPASLAAALSPAELRHVLLHERAHLARRDDWMNLAGRLIGAVLALHPLAWWILRRIEREREIACDDDVVAHGGVKFHASDCIQDGGAVDTQCLRNSAGDDRPKPPPGKSGVLGVTNLPQFAAQIAGHMDHPVVDRTGMTGNNYPLFIWGDDPPPPAEAPQINPATGVGTFRGPTVPQGRAFIAMLEQSLGLTLELRTEDIPVYTVKHVERPNPN